MKQLALHGDPSPAPSGDAWIEGEYRYSLSRIVAPHEMGTVVWIMLNPSTADASKDDATIRRCRDYTKAWVYQKLVVVNLFALRATDPKALYTHPDPVGPKNDRVLEDLTREANVIVCAWGAHGGLHGRSRVVATRLRALGRELHCLTTTKDGHPAHPLRLTKSLTPVPYRVLYLREGADD